MAYSITGRTSNVTPITTNYDQVETVVAKTNITGKTTVQSTTNSLSNDKTTIASGAITVNNSGVYTGTTSTISTSYTQNGISTFEWYIVGAALIVVIITTLWYFKVI